MKKFVVLFSLLVSPVWAEQFHLAVSERADSAGEAKNMAMSNAEKQVIDYVLSSKLGEETFTEISPNITDSDRKSLILGVSIENERQSETAYEADLYINVSDEAVKKYIRNNELKEIPNPISVLPNFGKDYFVFDLNGLREWAKIRQIISSLEESGIKMQLEAITGNSARFSFATGNLNLIKNTFWNNGFQITDMDGYYKARL